MSPFTNSSPAPWPRRTAAGLACAAAVGMLTSVPSARAIAGDPAPAGSHLYTAQLRIGENDATRGCSGVLVSKQWMLTAANCFAATPGAEVPAGKPALKSTATLGKQSVDIVEVVPRNDRDVVMARLSQPIANVTPVTLSGVAPAPGETLTGVGFGRTKTVWVPDAPHTGSFRVDSADATTTAVTGTDGAAICQGDTGGPLLRVKDGKAELVALHSRSWQGGCLASQETRTGAVDARSTTWPTGSRKSAGVTGCTPPTSTATARPTFSSTAPTATWSTTAIWAPASRPVRSCPPAGAASSTARTWAVSTSPTSLVTARPT